MDGLDNFVSKLASTYDSALESKDVIFTLSETKTHVETQYDIEFEVCYAPSLAKKPQVPLPIVDHGIDPVAKAVAEKVNPFLPHTPALFVTNVGRHHKVLLNKFPVRPRHVLVVTNEFKSQNTPLLPDDLLAVWYTLKAMNNRNALAIYNCGSKSGASQPHKHAQIVPLDTPSPTSILVKEQSSRRKGQSAKQVGEVFSIPFYCVNHVVLLETPEESHRDMEDILVTAYIKLMDAMTSSLRDYASHESLTEEEQKEFGANRRSIAYNWILTDEFMMIVPRRYEGVGDIHINSMGFAGMILVKTERELDQVNKEGIVEIVSRTGFGFSEKPSGEEPTEEEKEKKRLEQKAVEQHLKTALSSL